MSLQIELLIERRNENSSNTHGKTGVSDSISKAWWSALSADIPYKKSLS